MFIRLKHEAPVVCQSPSKMCSFTIGMAIIAFSVIANGQTINGPNPSRPGAWPPGVPQQPGHIPQGVPGSMVPPIPGVPGSRPYVPGARVPPGLGGHNQLQKQHDSRLQMSRLKAKEMAVDGQFNDAKGKWAKANMDWSIATSSTKRFTPPRDADWEALLSLENYKGDPTKLRSGTFIGKESYITLRLKANWARRAGRPTEAFQFATKAIEAKKREYRDLLMTAPGASDHNWLLKFRDAHTKSQRLEKLIDVNQVFLAEYRDKWLSDASRYHDGGLLAEQISKIEAQVKALSAQSGKKDEFISLERQLAAKKKLRSEKLAEARRLDSQVQLNYADAEFEYAGKRANDLVSKMIEIYGENDPVVAVTACESMRVNHRAGHRGINVAWPYKIAKKAATGAFGEKHWRSRDARRQWSEWDFVLNLGVEKRDRLLRMRGRIVQAEMLMARGEFKKALKTAEDDVDYLTRYTSQGRSFLAISLVNYAEIHRSLGLYRDAIRYQRKAADIYRQVHLEDHPDRVEALLKLRELYSLLGDHTLAYETAMRAGRMAKNVWGANHPRYAICMAHLASIFNDLQAYARAEKLASQSLTLITAQKDSLRPREYNWVMATAVACAARADFHLGELERASQRFSHTHKQCKKLYGEMHFVTIDALMWRGIVARAQRKFDLARQCLSGAISKFEGNYTKTHSLRVECLYQLALLEIESKHPALAAAHVSTCLDAMREQLDSTFSALSEKQQLEMTRQARKVLDLYVSLKQDQKQVFDVYEHLLAWKGAVFAAQRSGRRLATDVASKERLKSLDDVSRRIASLSLAATSSEKQRDGVSQLLSELEEKKARLEADLARGNPAKKKENIQLFKAVAATIPPDTALVDFLEFQPPWMRPDDSKPPSQLVAFVVRSDKKVTAHFLGEVAPIQRAADAWREQIVRRRGGLDRGLGFAKKKVSSGENVELPQKTLRHLVWKPLEPHLKGVKHVLISPDGALARVPLACLPGKDPKKYILEEYAVSVLPVPRLLGETTGEARASGNDKMSMLCVGGVDFGALPGKLPSTGTENEFVSRSVVRATKMHFGQLPGTEREIVQIGRLFRDQFSDAKLLGLRAGEATEQKLRSVAPKYRYLHVATHGYFTPLPVKKSGDSWEPGAIDARHKHPGLLSGLALAGANRGSTIDRFGNVSDDGVLTALEVAALDLRNVDVVNLSACETGLGQTAGGEGVLGLQRAFQVAGAKTTVTSLWKVDDNATQTLMIEFYRNLWVKKLSKLEALRQAQLTMLNSYDPKAGKLTSRGLGHVGGDKNKKPATAGGRLPPFYWAAFTLSGDWR